MQPTVETIPLLTLASGDRLMLSVYRFQGKQPGKRCYVQANLHGAEIVGNQVIQQLIEKLTGVSTHQLSGEICLVPRCNPLATNQRHHFFASGRYNPYDGRDWNRIFWDYEKRQTDLAEFVTGHLHSDLATIEQAFRKRQQEAFADDHRHLTTVRSAPWYQQYRYQLQSLCLGFDYILDLHSSSNQGLDYCYCFASREPGGHLLGFDYGILMTTYDGDAFDEAWMKPWLALEREFKRQGRPLQFEKEAFTLELGSGMTMNPSSVTRGVQGIWNYWLAKGLLQLPQVTPTKTDTQFGDRQQMQGYYSNTGGLVKLAVTLGQQITAGDLLYELIQYQEGQPQVVTICATAPGIVFDVGYNQSVNQGEYVLTLWTDKTD